MSEQSKHNILARLRSRQATSPQDKLKSTAKVTSDIRPSQESAPLAEVSEFVALLQANHTQVIETAYSDLNKALNSHLSSRKEADTHADLGTNQSPKHIAAKHLISKHPRLTQLLDKTALGLEEVDADNIHKASLFNACQSSVCYAETGIINRGALVIKASTYQPRSLTLVPPISLIIVEKSKLVASFEEALSSDYFAKEQLTSNTILISGPSKTADIQQTLAYGAHGPKHLIVFLVS